MSDPPLITEIILALRLSVGRVLLAVVDALAVLEERAHAGHGVEAQPVAGRGGVALQEGEEGEDWLG